MATLSAAELAKIRQECSKTLTVNYSKSVINAAAQAIEDWFVANQASATAAIDAATDPVTLSNPQKKKISAEVFNYKYNKDK